MVVTAGSSAADTIAGTLGNDFLYGAAGNDTLSGLVGNDTLVGGVGNDTLTGSAVADRFLFATGAPFSLADLGLDTLTDFNATEDRIHLDDSTFTALTGGASLDPSTFAVVSSDTAAASSGAAIVYNSTNGKLFYNPNGSAAGFAATADGGGAFATLLGDGVNPLPALTSNAFLIV
jgi:Ca2+-binding RTX toxin-like protein